jgi:hypothetical protein
MILVEALGGSTGLVDVGVNRHPSDHVPHPFQDVRFASLNPTRAVDRAAFLIDNREHDAVPDVEDVLNLEVKFVEGAPPVFDGSRLSAGRW